MLRALPYLRLIFVVGLTGGSPLAFAAQDARRLNNFVTELKHIAGADAKSARVVEFEAARTGWVYVVAKGQAEGVDRVLLTIKGLPPEQALTITASAREAHGQFFLDAGKEILEISRAGSAELQDLSIRQAPEIGFSKFRATTVVRSGRGLDWPFLEKYILPHVNTVVGMDKPATEEFVRQWKLSGGRWFTEVSRTEDPKEVLEKFGMNNPEVDGIFVDEMVGGRPAIEKWIAAMPALKKEADKRDKEIRLYFAGDSRNAPAFVDASLSNHIKVSWEKYIGEPGREPAAVVLPRFLKNWMAGLAKSHPGVVSNSIICLGMMSVPPLSANRSSEIDFKVWMDMLLQQLAIEPEFNGLPGVMEYITRYTDEETFRWAALLLQHYCLDGKTNLLSDEYGFSYALKHIKNPDFRDELSNWVIEPAGASVSAKKVTHLGTMQGRYPEQSDWDYAALVNPSNGPVRLKQQVQALKKGQLYSAKVISVRQSDLESGVSKPEFHPVHLRIAGTTRFPERSYRQMVNIPASGTVPPFTNESRLWIDYTFEVFYAEATTAALEIEVDGKADPLYVNFVEVQPYLP